MKYIAAILVSVFLSVGITLSVMQDSHRQEVEQVRVDEFNSGFLDGMKESGSVG